MNPSIIYWKWDDSHLDGRYLDEIEDICKRSCFSHIYVTTHWCNYGTASATMHDIIAKAVEKVHGLGRKFIFEIDARAEKKYFLERFPERLGFLYTREIKLDESGKASYLLNIVQEEQCELFFASNHYSAEVVDARSYFKEKDLIDENSVTAASAICKRINNKQVEVCVSAEKGANRYAYVAVCSYVNFPDFSSRNFYKFFTDLIERYSDIPLDGVALDEFSLPVHPDFNFTNRTYNDWDRCRLYGVSMSKAYEKKYNSKFFDDVFDSYYLPPDNKKRISAINRYFEFIRSMVTEYETMVYDLTKKYFGKDAFVGVHPTWFAIEEVDNTPEVWKNGIDWWDVKRDYGFTDEIMLYPVRTGLAHKASANIFYNMWYSEATLDYRTFFPEMWRNVRYGGRTISLSYECIYEKHLLVQLREPGILEQISDIEQEISLIDKEQTAPVRSDILIVTGIEAACNILANMVANSYWDTERGNFKDSFKLARDVFNLGYNCDLVGNYEIYNGNIYINDRGYVQYGNQEYKFIIFHALQFSKKILEEFVKKVKQSKTGCIVIGKTERDFDGDALNIPYDYIVQPQARDLIPLFEKYGARTNTVPNGCILQDGSIIFTAPSPDKATGNVFETTFIYEDKTYHFVAEDYLFLKKENGGLKKISPNLIAFYETGE